MLSDKTIKDLKDILKSEYGRDVSLDTAAEIAQTLVTYFDTLGRIYFEIKNENHETESNNIKS